MSDPGIDDTPSEVDNRDSAFKERTPGRTLKSILELEDELRRKEQKIAALESLIRERDEKIETLREDFHNFNKEHFVFINKSNKNNLLNKVQNQKTLQRLRKVRDQERIKNRCNNYISIFIIFIGLSIATPSLYVAFMQSSKIVYLSLIFASIGLLWNVLPIPPKQDLWDILKIYMFKQIRKDEIGIIIMYGVDTGVLKDGTSQKSEYIEIIVRV
ncbi:MAG TPA: hypothetical protein PKV33_00800 [Methanothrix sp.]|nr:hypothetical protein [Methanothrix sp.]